MNRALRILFVEDMPDIQKVGIRLFQAAGHRVYLAANGREAVDIFDRESVDVVVMDLQMPEMDGWQAAREIRRHEQTARGVPIIAVSAYTQQAEPERIRAAGIDAFIAKPLDNARLFQTIAALCPENSAYDAAGALPDEAAT
jgi:CheY-like chemotaxis protein